MTLMYGPAVRRKRISSICRRCGLASMYPASLLGATAPGHHGCQRACGLISGQASNGPSGSPGFTCAGKTGPPSRLILSQTSAGKRDYVIAFSLSSSSFVRAVSRSFVPACSMCRAPRAGAVKAGRSLRPPAGLGLVWELRSQALFHGTLHFLTSFIPVSLFDLESRFFAPTRTCWTPSRAGAVKAGRRSAIAHAPSFGGRALIDPSTAAHSLWSG
jgi:hypothetical protein